MSRLVPSLTQAKLTYSAVRQYDERLIDHNLIQGQIDSLVHYHQGLVCTHEMGSVRTDDLLDRMIHSAETRMSQTLIDTISKHISDPKQVLDVGFGKLGTGILFSQVFHNCKIWGLELSNYSHEYSLAQQYVINNPNKFKLLRSNFLDYDFEYDAFQCVYLMESLQFCIDIQKLFKQFYKWTSERGVVVLSQMLANELCPLSELIKTVDKVNRVYDSVIHTQKEVIDALQSNSFEVVEIIDLTHDVINYWRLRQRWGFKTIVDNKILEEYCQDHLQYTVIVAKPIK